MAESSRKPASRMEAEPEVQDRRDLVHAADDANDAAVRSQLQTLRGQIELYRAQNSADPALLDTGWDELVDGDYLMGAPSNPLASSSTIADEAAEGVGWVWRAKSDTNPTLALYATAADGSEFSE